MTGGFFSGQKLPEGVLPVADRVAIRAYLEASGDDNPLHHDTDAARQAGFADILVPGMLIAGQMAAWLGRACSGARIEGFDVRFILPVVAASALRLDGRVVALRPDGTVVFRLLARFEGQVAVLGEAVVRPD